jgi:hypothetical protein
MSDRPVDDETRIKNLQLMKEMRNVVAIMLIRFQMVRRRHERGDVDGPKTTADFVAMDGSLKRMTILIERIEARLGSLP